MDDLKTYCIEFERELEGKDVIHIQSYKKPTPEQAVNFIIEDGYLFNDGYDIVRNIYMV